MPSWSFYHIVADYYCGMSKLELNHHLEDYLRPVKNALDALYEQEYQHVNQRGMYTNRVGVTLTMNQINKRKAKSDLLAHVIQGAESQIVCNMIIACHNARIQTFSYQYDGLVTDKPIPPLIIEDVIKVTGLNFALKNKPFGID